ncbi:hypothetical protein [Subtercola endophyticus]|uniref:hypothetical protein n=1 Tax=Subtercola endophyticus TaxID=2895559 RepID=UPI001E2BAAC3|nr:hypothetical protein [Subtercola endophyticus]UFS60737.1 hypothetical protein LQ955_08380 [Subtercola endophyticus]
MSINTRTRLVTVGLIALTSLTTAIGGASVAQASTGSTGSVISFSVPGAGPGEHRPAPINFFADVSNIGSLQAADFSFLMECSDGGMYPLTAKINPANHALQISGELPDSETGNTCALTITVDQAGRSVQLSNHAPLVFQPAAVRNVYVVGSMPTYSRTGGL